MLGGRVWLISRREGSRIKKLKAVVGKWFAFSKQELKRQNLYGYIGNILLIANI